MLGRRLRGFEMKETDGVLDDKLAAIKHKEMLIHISPTYDLSLSNTLLWVVREVEPVPVKSPGHSAEASASTSIEDESVPIQFDKCTEASAEASIQTEHANVQLEKPAQIEPVSIQIEESIEAPPKTFVQVDAVSVKAEKLVHSLPENAILPGHTKSHEKSPQHCPATPSQGFLEA